MLENCEMAGKVVAVICNLYRVIRHEIGYSFNLHKPFKFSTAYFPNVRSNCNNVRAIKLTNLL